MNELESRFERAAKACLLLQGKSDNWDRAEQLAREVARCWEPWGGPRAPAITWVVAPLPVLVPRILAANEPTVAAHPVDRIRAALGPALQAALRNRSPGRRQPAPSAVATHPLGSVLARALDDARDWHGASARRLAIPAANLSHMKFDDLSDPFEPLLELWTLGYALGAHVGEHLELFAAAPAAPDQPEVLAASLAYLALDLASGFPAPLDWRTQCAPDRDPDEALAQAWDATRDPMVLLRVHARAVDAPALARSALLLARDVCPHMGHVIDELLDPETTSERRGDVLMEEADPMLAGRGMDAQGASAFDCFLRGCEVLEKALYSDGEGVADVAADAAELAAQVYAMQRAGENHSVTQAQWEQGLAQACEVIRGLVPRPRHADLVKERGSPA
jgi:hypothetical protein